jgi:hypothetical protein
VPAAVQDPDWIRQSRVRQLFSDDLEPDEVVHHTAEVTVTSAKFDRPVRGWAIATDRALRISWGLATTVSQSQHVEYDRMRQIEIDDAEPCSVHLTYFDAARTTTAWYQALRLHADAAELTTALPQLVARRRRHLAEPVEAPATPSDTGHREDGVLVVPAPPAPHVTAARSADVTPDVRRRSRRLLTRR